MKTQRSADLVAGSLFALLGLTVVLASRGIPEGAGGYLHPKTFPFLLGLALTLSGALVSIRARFMKTGSEGRIDWPDGAGWKKWLLALVLMGGYVALCGPLGFLVSTFTFVLIFSKFFGRYPWRVGVICALGTSLFVYGMFVKLLDLTLPLGPLALLWE